MALKLSKNLLSNNNMQNVLYLVILALAISYIMNRQNLALVSLLVVAGIVYMFKKNVILALGVSIIITNLLLSMNYFRQFEGFKEGNTGGSHAALRAGNRLQAGSNSTNCPVGSSWNDQNGCVRDPVSHEDGSNNQVSDTGGRGGRSGGSGGR